MNEVQNRQLGFWETVRQNVYLKTFGTSLIGVVAQINGPLTADIVKQSLHLLFDQQPLLRARIEKIGLHYFFKLDCDFADIPITIIKKNSPTTWHEVFECELSKPPPSEHYVWKAFFIEDSQVTNKHSLIVFFHHVIADGISAVYFIKNFLEFCQLQMSSQLIEITPLPLMPCVENMFNQKITWFEFMENMKKSCAATPAETAWYYSDTKPVGERITRNLFAEIPTSKLSKLHEECRAEGVTLNSALAAALLLSGHQRIHEDPISVLTFVDLRKHCNPVLRQDYLGCYVTGILTRHHIQGEYQTKSTKTFWETAKEYQQQLHDAISKVLLTPYEFSPADLENFSIVNPFGAPAKSQQSFGIDFCLTNLGNVDIPQNYGELQLDNFNFCTSRQAGDVGLLANVVSIQQKMFICFGYTEPLIAANSVNALINATMQWLIK